MYRKKMFSLFLDFIIDNEEPLKNRGVVIDNWFLEFIFKFEGKAGKVAFTYNLINELESFQGLAYEITSEQLIIGKIENAIELSYPFDEFPQLQKIMEPLLSDFIDLDCCSSRAGEAIALLFDLRVLGEKLCSLEDFDWDVYHQDLSPVLDLVSKSDVNDLENLRAEAEDFVESYLNGEGEYLPDEAYEALSGDYTNWPLDDFRELAEVLGDTEFMCKVEELSNIVELFYKISANYRSFHGISYELYQDRLSKQRYKNGV